MAEGIVACLVLAFSLLFFEKLFPISSITKQRRDDKPRRSEALMSSKFRLEEFIDRLTERADVKVYIPKLFTDTRYRYGTVQAIKMLISSREIRKYDLIWRLRELNLLDLSVEAAVLKFPENFTFEEQKTARWRLKQIELMWHKAAEDVGEHDGENGTLQTTDIGVATLFGWKFGLEQEGAISVPEWIFLSIYFGSMFCGIISILLFAILSLLSFAEPGPLMGLFWLLWFPLLLLGTAGVYIAHGFRKDQEKINWHNHMYSLLPNSQRPSRTDWWLGRHPEFLLIIPCSVFTLMIGMGFYYIFG